MMPEFIPKKEFMLECLRLARLALEQGEVPVGAVVELDGKIIGYGFNQRESLNDPTAHAEMLAIKMASKNLNSWRLTNANLYVSLEPCAMCAGTAVNARIKRVIFGAHDETSGCCGSALDFSELGNTHKTLMYRGYMESECAEILREFFKSIR